jgi:putative ABC transport system permease protein
VGLLATVVAALLPAWRASRLAPVAALHDTAAESPQIQTTARILGILLPAAGAGLLALGLFGGGGLPAILAGSLVVLVGVAAALQQLARPIVAVLAAPLRRAGLSGQLARENAMRNPRRAAVTAGALMIGLALVSLASVFTASAKTSINEIIDERFAGDYAVFSEDFLLDPAIADRLEGDPAFSAVARWRTTELVERSAAGRREFTDVYGTDTAVLTDVYDPVVLEGSVADLADGGVALQRSAADDRGLALGDALQAAFGTPSGEQPITLTVEVVYEDTTIGDMIVSLPHYASSFPGEDEFLLLKAASDDLTAATAAVEAIGTDYPTVTAQDRTAFKEDAAAAADQLLTLILALLTLAIIIAVLGIVNTLALSVVERTQEIGLLRAVGMSRRQVGRMIRGEAVLLALLGGVVGIALGVGLALALVPQVEDITVLEIPMVQLGTFLAACIVVGLVAALLPARRAARMNVLRAISAD